MMKRIIRKILLKAGLWLPVMNVNHSQFNKNCLLMYIDVPFLSYTKSKDAHQNIWQTQEIARIIGELGYNVDVLDYRATRTIFTKKYDMVFDICVKDEPIYSKYLNENAKKIVYFTGSESEFANSAEQKRIADLAERRGVTMVPRRQAPLISREVEKFDGALLIGNAYNLRTYEKFNLKKTFLIPNTGYDFGDRFDVSKRSAHNFLFFGSVGAVHKGLDLLLEIFSEKDFPATLYVCGCFEQESDFVQAYKNELYACPNIKPIGYVNILSEKFTQIASECVYTILPSCSEGMAGTITTAMSAGIIPICSKECGFEDDEVINLPNCEIDTIRSVILRCCNCSEEEIKIQSKRVLSLCNEKYSRFAFTTAMTNAIEEIIS